MRRRKGFTVVEIIIVIAVIAILAAILIPVFSNIIDKSNAKTATADAKTVITTFTGERYSGNDVFIPDILCFMQKGGKIYVFAYTQTLNEITAYKENPFEQDKNLTYAQNVKAVTDILAARGAITLTSELSEYYLDINFATWLTSNNFDTNEVGMAVNFQIDDLLFAGKIPEGAEVSTANEFLNITDMNANYYLTEDIDMSSLTTWSPIGFGEGQFNGLFSGNGHKITGIPKNANGTYSGLFYSNAGTIRDLYVTVAIDADEATIGAAGIACINNGTIKNCGVSGSIKIEQSIGFAGGIAAMNTNGGMIDSCWSKIEIEAPGKEVGGIAGQTSVAMISNSYSYQVKLTGKNAAGITSKAMRGSIVDACYTAESDISSTEKSSYICTFMETGEGVQVEIVGCYYNEATLTGTEVTVGTRLGNESSWQAATFEGDNWNLNPSIPVWTLSDGHYPALINNPIS